MTNLSKKHIGAVFTESSLKKFIEDYKKIIENHEKKNEDFKVFVESKNLNSMPEKIKQKNPNEIFCFLDKCLSCQKNPNDYSFDAWVVGIPCGHITKCLSCAIDPSKPKLCCLDSCKFSNPNWLQENNEIYRTMTIHTPTTINKTTNITYKNIPFSPSDLEI